MDLLLPLGELLLFHLPHHLLLVRLVLGGRRAALPEGGRHFCLWCVDGTDARDVYVTL